MGWEIFDLYGFMSAIGLSAYVGRARLFVSGFNIMFVVRSVNLY